jgi:hypothetical protein
MPTAPKIHRPVNPTVDQIYLYDQAVRDWLQGVEKLLGNDPLTVVFATPQRAFATIQRMWAAKHGAERAAKLTTLPYPVITVTRTAQRFAPERFQGFHAQFPRVQVSTDGMRAYNVVFPRPWDLDYQVDVLTRHRQTLNAIQMWLMEELTRETFLTIDFTSVWSGYGTKEIPIRGLDLTDNSDLEPEEADRELRLTLSVTARGWLFLPPVPVPLVLKIVAEAFDATLGTTSADAATVQANPQTYPLLDRLEIDEQGVG